MARIPRWLLGFVVLSLFWIVLGDHAAWAQDEPPTLESLAAELASVKAGSNLVWTMVGSALVFFMQAGFAMVETGFTRAKNAANIVLKNLMDFCFGSIAYWFIGFGLMFGSSNGFFGTSWFAFSWLTGTGSTVGADGIVIGDAWPFTFFCFQVVFAATSATIVSGAMAERTKFISYLIYSVFISLIVYPISGGWAWNSLFGAYNGGTSGWLGSLGYVDYAGSGVVHVCGGAAALAGALVLGPRTGKFGSNGEARAIPGHNLPLGILGVFILYFGWIGFNAGSTTAAIQDMGWIAFNTYLAGAAGAIGAMVTTWIIFSKPDTSFTGNGALAGLVGITAGCWTVHPLGAIIIGGIGGVLVVFAVLFIENVLKIDDPVGASSVHGVGGVWGVLAAGIPFFAHANAGITWGTFGVQILAAASIAAWSFFSCLILFVILKVTIGLRVTVEEEVAGLDIGEHGNVSYPDFVSVATDSEHNY
ncbi:MAG: ammonium transporter [Cyanobacteriota bacterium]|nr:ammonium transporter [Cyanobacteriota bacterium]